LYRLHLPFVVRTALCATLAWAACGQAAPAASSRYVGTYHAVRAGADSVQDITLTLDASGSARMITKYPGYTKTAAGQPVYPWVETGAWRPARKGAIDLNLTEGGVFVAGSRIKRTLEATKLGLVLTECVLSTIRDENSTYGTSELIFRKAGCD